MCFSTSKWWSKFIFLNVASPTGRILSTTLWFIFHITIQMIHWLNTTSYPHCLSFESRICRATVHFTTHESNELHSHHFHAYLLCKRVTGGIRTHDLTHQTECSTLDCLATVDRHLIFTFLFFLNNFFG